jgi:hypothetical protein
MAIRHRRRAPGVTEAGKPKLGSAAARVTDAGSSRNVEVVEKPDAQFTPSGLDALPPADVARKAVANMYFIPAGLLIELDDTWLHATAGLPDTDGLTWGRVRLRQPDSRHDWQRDRGGLMVGAVYWFVYLRPRPGGVARSRSGRRRATAQAGTHGE